MDLDTYLQSQSDLIEKKLSKLVPEQKQAHGQLFKATRYALLGNGKRIRPILALATAEAFGKRPEGILEPVCALEMIHTYSLIHDDLPCMDDDNMRRGKPTLHKVFPEGHAVLTGDFLLTYAFEVITNTACLTSDQKVQLVNILAKQAGGYSGMIAGQVLDIEAENKPISLEALKQIHLCKTGALITASVEFGGVLAGVTEDILTILRRFGRDIGLAFQVVDDILDVTASEEKHGKASDTINGKATYVSLLGLEQAKATAQSLYRSALDTLKPLPNMTILEKIAERIVSRQK